MTSFKICPRPAECYINILVLLVRLAGTMAAQRCVIKPRLQDTLLCVRMCVPMISCGYSARQPEYFIRQIKHTNRSLGAPRSETGNTRLTITDFSYDYLTTVAAVGQVKCLILTSKVEMGRHLDMQCDVSRTMISDAKFFLFQDEK
jgi:hypothetical protein